MLYEKLTKKEMIIRLYKAGLRQIDISRQLKINTNYVWKVVHESGLK